VKRTLAETGLDPTRLELEITEGVLIEDGERALETLRQLKALGVSIAMDDFGTGYSSLSYFRRFPFDKVKIDQSFVRDMLESPQARAIVRSVIGLGRGLDMPVLAEGVETDEQLQALLADGCDQVQGFLISRPGPIATFEHLYGGIQQDEDAPRAAAG
jgi:EAL domain-containing protein (putative c-di-GMP-specific phosphodiesterase class I)